MTDLLAIIESDTPLKRVANTNGGEYAGPCPFCGGKDRFRVWPTPPDGRPRWWCRQCDRHGDAIAYLRQRYGLSYREALERLGESPESPPNRPAAPPPLSLPATQPSWDWRTAEKVLLTCEAALWSPTGQRARDWLAKRGLEEESLRTWRIGYNPADRKIEGIFVPRGIVIPCLVDGKIWYLKVRRPVPPLPGPKYQQVKGGRTALFGLDLIEGKSVAVICEGELDAILLWQEAGDLVDVVALGSATARPAFLPRLVMARYWLVATDRDRAGERAAAWWGEFSSRVRRVRPPQGNDLTDFYLAGGDLRAWVEFYLAVVGNLNPSGPDPLVLRAVRDLGAICTTGGFEAQADILLSQAEDTPAWRRRWAMLALAAGWECAGESWEEWAR